MIKTGICNNMKVDNSKINYNMNTMNTNKNKSLSEKKKFGPIVC